MRKQEALPKISVVFPVYNEEETLPALFERLDALFRTHPDFAFEVIFVDDHSSDGTTALLRNACTNNDRFQFLRLASNRGQHLATAAGLERATGDCCAFMDSDLQDPPELIVDMAQRWREGADVVWAVREKRMGVKWSEKFFSGVFHFLIRRLGQVDWGARGADFVLIDRKVVAALLQSLSARPIIVGDIASLGFRQSNVPYTRQARHGGASKWNLARKLNLFADAFVSYSYFPLRLMSYSGIVLSIAGILYAVDIIIYKMFGGKPVEGWASLMVAVLFIGGIQMIMLGVIGEYMWRTLEETRRRPRYFIEESSDNDTKRRVKVKRGEDED